MAESLFSKSSWRSTLEWLKSRAAASWHGIATDLYNSINWGCITEKVREQRTNNQTKYYTVLTIYQAVFSFYGVTGV